MRRTSVACGRATRCARQGVRASKRRQGTDGSSPNVTRSTHPALHSGIVSIESPGTTHSLIDVLDRVIDKGVRIGGARRVWLGAIELVKGGAWLVLVADEKRLREDDGPNRVGLRRRTASGAD
jgi:hypothetical protein